MDLPLVYVILRWSIVVHRAGAVDTANVKEFETIVENVLQTTPSCVGFPR